MSPCGEATPELLSSSSHSVLHECIYPLGRCPSNAILASPGWRITCNVILPHLSLTHVPGSVGNARRAPWLLPSMFLAPCQNSQSMNWASLVAQMVKNLPAMQDTRIQSLGQEDPLEKGMATHSSVLAWRIPRTQEPGGLQSMGLPLIYSFYCSKFFQFSSVAQSCLTLCDFMDYSCQAPLSIEFSRQEY